MATTFTEMYSVGNPIKVHVLAFFFKETAIIAIFCDTCFRKGSLTTYQYIA